MKNTIQHEWSMIARTLQLDLQPATQREHSQRMFYLGAEAVLRILVRLGDDEISEDSGAIAFQGLIDETTIFAREIGTKARLPQAVVDAISPPQPAQKSS